MLFIPDPRGILTRDMGITIGSRTLSHGFYYKRKAQNMQGQAMK